MLAEFIIIKCVLDAVPQYLFEDCIKDSKETFPPQNYALGLRRLAHCHAICPAGEAYLPCSLNKAYLPNK